MRRAYSALLLAAFLAVCLCGQGAKPAQKQAVRYEVIDIGLLPWVSYDVAPHIGASNSISWWQAASDGALHAAVSRNNSLQDLGALPGFSSSIASGLNSQGQIIGWSVSGRNLVDSLATTRAFLYMNSRMLELGTLGGRDTKALGINDAGQVVGQSSLPDKSMHAFLYMDGRMTDLGSLPGGAFSAAYAINNHALIAGAAETSTHLVHAVMWSDGHATDLGTLPGGMRSRALALNDKAEIVGFSEAPGAETHAFLFTNGRMQDLGSLGSDPVRADAINNRSQIVGSSGVSHLVRHAFVWENGIIQDLNKLIPAASLWRLDEAFDINDQGQILCAATRADATRDRHLLLLRPITSAKPSI